MKDCTKSRWNSRNATSSGAAVSRVAALITDQSMPWSVEAKTGHAPNAVRLALAAPPLGDLARALRDLRRLALQGEEVGD